MTQHPAPTPLKSNLHHMYPPLYPLRTAKPTGLDSKLETPAQIFLKGKLLSLKSYRNFSNLFAHTDKCKYEVRSRN